MPDEMLNTLIFNRDQLQELISACRSPEATARKRTDRNSLLRTTVFICRFNVKIWAYGRFEEGVMNADDVHSLGFLLPGENGGRHPRKKPTGATPHIVAQALSPEKVRIVLYTLREKDEAMATHGWPEGVRQALLVIKTADGKEEVFRGITGRRHTNIEIPGRHGQQFLVAAAYLRHLDDTPVFGHDQTFSLPYMTSDIGLSIKQKHEEEKAAWERKIEELEREIRELKVKS
jgi:hypothetical protein